MKPRILNTMIAAAFTALPVVQAGEEKEPVTNSASSTVTTNTDGTATVTIEVNGKKETKTFKLGDGQPFTFKLKDGDAEAGGVVGGKDVLKFLKRDPAKKEKATWLGVSTEPVSEEMRAQLPLKVGEGLVVTHVAPDSPAARAGLEPHDILTRLEGQILVQPEQLKSLVKMQKAGDKVKLSYLRKGETKDVEVALEEHEFTVAQDEVFRFFNGPGGPQWNLKDLQPGELRDRLKNMKDNWPGVIVDKKAFVVGPDGEVKHFEGNAQLGDVLELARKHLDGAKLPPEVRQEIRKAVEEALQKAKGAVEEVEKSVQKEIEKVEKKDGEKPRP